MYDIISVFNTTELTFNMVEMANLRLCVFYHNKKNWKKKRVDQSSPSKDARKGIPGGRNSLCKAHRHAS